MQGLPAHAGCPAFAVVGSALRSSARLPRPSLVNALALRTTLPARRTLIPSSSHPICLPGPAPNDSLRTQPAAAPSVTCLLAPDTRRGTAQGEADILRGLFEKYAVPAVDWVLEGVDGEELVRRPKQAVPMTNLNMVTQLCSLLAATITDHPRMSDPQVRQGVGAHKCVFVGGRCVAQGRDGVGWGLARMAWEGKERKGLRRCRSTACHSTACLHAAQSCCAMPL